MDAYGLAGRELLQQALRARGVGMAEFGGEGMSARMVQVFNRYLFSGGEEKSVDRIYNHLSSEHQMSRCFFESAEWKREGAPGLAGQLRRLFYNT